MSVDLEEKQRILEISDIRARLESAQASTVSVAKLMGELEATMQRNKAVFKKLEKKMAAQILKARDAKQMSKALISKRKK